MSNRMVDIADIVDELVAEIAPERTGGALPRHEFSSARIGPMNWNSLPTNVQQTINSWLNNIPVACKSAHTSRADRWRGRYGNARQPSFPPEVG
jgi:hypothetical protein